MGTMTAKETPAEKASWRANAKTQAPAKASNATTAFAAPHISELVPASPPEASKAPAQPTASDKSLYVGRLDLTRRCNGATPLTRAPIDFTGILADADALRAMSDDLFRPFRQSSVDMVVAVLDDSSSAHGFTAAIAGAVAGHYGTALGQVTVHRPEPPQPVAAPSPRPRAKKRGRPPSKTSIPPVAERSFVNTHVPLECQRVASFHHEATGLSVEYRRELMPSSRAGVRILLVSDWVESLDSLVAARDALMEAGGDAVGVGIVVAASSTVLEELSKQQILYSCSWTPASGAQLTLGDASGMDGVRCQCDAGGSNDASPKRAKVDNVFADVEFQHFTSQYEANAPSEDRSVNAVHPSDPAVRLYAVLDGHGGSVAVDHLRRTLCNEIFSRVCSESSPVEIEDALTQAFNACDMALKSFLESLPPDVRMSKGYCNAGSCAVVTLVVGSMLYTANVGDCGAVIGRRDPLTDRVRARELSTEHNCRNANEVRLVMERSRDRNAIRLSKDDQESENVYGVRRVAGSLAVTRAFGDFYLKCEELSSSPFKSKVPYITVEPSICQYDLREHDADEQTLILASDGLWEVVGCEEAVKIATQFDAQQSVLFPSCSAALVHVVLEKVAHRDGMLLHELMALPRGRDRRRFHDDVTCTVVRIKASRPRLSSIETHEESEPTRITDEEPSQT